MRHFNKEYEQYIHSRKWREIADRRLETDHHICCVCGKTATEVHHMTYANFMEEKQEDLVSLCHTCHEKAEEIADFTVLPEAKANNFMAFMRTDAAMTAPIVFDYLLDVRGKDFDSLMRLRQPTDKSGKQYWSVLKKAVHALCRKRYDRTSVEDRKAMMMDALFHHIEVICLSQIEHTLRNRVQASLHDIVQTDYLLFEKWKDVGTELDIKPGTLQTLKKDDGTSYGPSLRETVLYYCGQDAVAGIYPLEGFDCLSDEDYENLRKIADYMISVSGTGAFKGEYTREVQQNARSENILREFQAGKVLVK